MLRRWLLPTSNAALRQLGHIYYDVYCSCLVIGHCRQSYQHRVPLALVHLYKPYYKTCFHNKKCSIKNAPRLCTCYKPQCNIQEQSKYMYCFHHRREAIRHRHVNNNNIFILYSATSIIVRGASQHITILKT